MFKKKLMLRKKWSGVYKNKLRLHEKFLWRQTVVYDARKSTSCRRKKVDVAQKKFHDNKKHRLLLHKKMFHAQKKHYFFPDRRAIQNTMEELFLF